MAGFLAWSGCDRGPSEVWVSEPWVIRSASVDEGWPRAPAPRRPGDPLDMTVDLTLVRPNGETGTRGDWPDGIVLREEGGAEVEAAPLVGEGGTWDFAAPGPGRWTPVAARIVISDERAASRELVLPPRDSDGAFTMPLAGAPAIDILPYGDEPGPAWEESRWRLEQFTTWPQSGTTVSDLVFGETTGVWVDVLGTPEAPQLRLVIDPGAGPCAILWDDATWTGTSLRWAVPQVGLDHPQLGPLELLDPALELAWAPGVEAPDGRADVWLPAATLATVVAGELGSGTGDDPDEEGCFYAMLVGGVCVPCPTGEGQCLHISAGQASWVRDDLGDDPPLCGVSLLGDGEAEPIEITCDCQHADLRVSWLFLPAALWMRRRRSHRKAQV